MFHVLSRNRYVGKNIIFDQCIFSLFLIYCCLFFSLSQLYRFKSNKPKNTHHCVTASPNLGYKCLKNGWIFFCFDAIIINCSPDHSLDILPHLTNNLRGLDFIDHSIGSRSLTHSLDQIKLSGGSSPILGVSNGRVWGGLLIWLKLIYSFSTCITNYF